MTTLTRSIAIALITLAVAGCGGSTNNTGNDAGNDVGSTTNPDMGVGNDMGAMHGGDTGPMVDVGVDGGCTSTMPHCNTCTTAATDPYNACSSYVTNCIAFDNTRVPGWPDHIPPVGP